jgi:PTH1 family peptidyl-tRNA hydrolase
MGGNNYLRLRLGIGHPGEKSKVTNHVLKKASVDDQISIERNIERALNVLPLVIEGDIQKAMNELHTDK